MMIKCKMCGGDLNFAAGATTCECEFCGTRQPVPKAVDENLQNLFNRANALRIKSEFDKAEKIYDIKGNLILCCMRTMSEEDAILVVEEGKKFLNKGVVGIDLAGPEEEGFVKKYKNALELANIVSNFWSKLT